MKKGFLIFLTLFSLSYGAIKQNGNWSPWSKIKSPCVSRADPKVSVACGGGVTTRYRSCSNPAPKNNGLNCVGEAKEETSCNTHPCKLPELFLWSEWTLCSKRCGRGKKKRNSLCGSIRKRKGSSNDVVINDKDEKYLKQFELEYESTCQSNQYIEQRVECNSWDPKICKSPCEPDDNGKEKCPKFAICLDKSTETDPAYECRCQLGKIMKDDKSECIKPPPTTPTPRPDPTLPPEQKAAANVLTKGASTVLIIFLTITILLFLVFRIFDSARIIHMNMEISLLLAHLCMLPTLVGNEEGCRMISILIHFFHIACFMFLFLESIHLYALVTWVVPKDGLLTPAQNTITGWGVAFIVVLFTMCFEYENYGGNYHCWLRMDKSIVFGNYLPILFLVIITFAIIEAAGSSDYEKLDNADNEQRLTAQIMQRTSLFILPLLLTSFITGSLAEYEQSLPLYGIFTIINGVLGGIIFFFHSTSNMTIRNYLVRIKRKICPCCTKKTADEEAIEKQN